MLGHTLDLRVRECRDGGLFLEQCFSFSDDPIEIGKDVGRGRFRLLQAFCAQRFLEENAAFACIEDTRDRFLKALRHPPLDVICPVAVLDYAHRHSHQKL